MTRKKVQMQINIIPWMYGVKPRWEIWEFGKQ